MLGLICQVILSSCDKNFEEKIKNWLKNQISKVVKLRQVPRTYLGFVYFEQCTLAFDIKQGLTPKPLYLPLNSLAFSLTFCVLIFYFLPICQENHSHYTLVLTLCNFFLQFLKMRLIWYVSQLQRFSLLANFIFCKYE